MQANMHHTAETLYRGCTKQRVARENLIAPETAVQHAHLLLAGESPCCQREVEGSTVLLRNVGCTPDWPCDRLLTPLLLLVPLRESSRPLLARRLCVKGCVAGGQATKGAVPPPQVSGGAAAPKSTYSDLPCPTCRTMEQMLKMIAISAKYAAASRGTQYLH